METREEDKEEEEDEGWSEAEAEGKQSTLKLFSMARGEDEDISSWTPKSRSPEGGVVPL